MPTARGYVRVSTEEQAVNGVSIDAQKEILQAYAVVKGYTDFKIYTDEGFSGKNLNRPDVQRLLEECRSGKVEAVIVWRLDRLSRSLRGDLLDAEAITRPALEALLTQNGIAPASYLQTSRVRACLNQYGLLTGCKGSLSYARRRALFGRILQDTDARAALRARLQADPNRLLALPYKLGLALRAPGLLAAYTLAKQRFL